MARRRKGNGHDAHSLFTRALALVTGMPDDERDLRLQAVLLGNLGNVAEARRDDWAAAYDTFTASQTHYDITHTQVSLSAAAAASGRQRESVEYGAAARRSIQSRGYGL